MISLSKLPTEILLQIFSQLSSSSLTSILQLNRSYQVLALPVFLSHLQLTTLTLPRCPLTLPSTARTASTTSTTDSNTTSSPNRRVSTQTHLPHLRAISITLNAPSKIFTTLTGLPFISLSPSAQNPQNQQTYLGIDYLNKVLQSSLTGLASTLSSNASLLGSLRRLTISVPEPPLNTFGVSAFSTTYGSAPKISQHALIALLHAAGQCSNLEVLEIDTNMSEDTSWNVASGVGSSCSNHVCAVFATMVGRLRLRCVRWRRREVCAALLDGSMMNGTAAGGGGGGGGRKMERLVLDLRTREIQRSGWDSWEAQSRECGCVGWCVGCLKRAEKSGGGEGEGESDNEKGYGLLDRMVKAATRVAKGMPNAKEVAVVGYECPEKELDNWARKPVVFDCLKGTKRAGEVGNMVE